MHGLPSGRLSSVGEEFSTNSSISTSSPKRSVLNDNRVADDASPDKLYKLQITIPKSANHSKVVKALIYMRVNIKLVICEKSRLLNVM